LKRILIIQLKRIGDFILTAPALAALRSAFPQAEIVLLVPKSVAELAGCIPAVSRVIAYQSGAANLETWSSAMVGEWDACLDFTGTDRSALVTKLSGAKQRLGYEKFASKGLRRLAYTRLIKANVRELHTVDFHLALVEALKIQDSGFKIQGECHSDLVSSVLHLASPIFGLPKRVMTEMRQKLAVAGITGRFAIVHPGTAREEKFWLDERWAEVCAALHNDFGLQVVLTGSGDGLEKSHLRTLKKQLHVPVVDLTGQCSLVELAALIAQCAIIVGVDSMAMHLAAQFRTPQVALFGPTNPFHWRPRHERGLVLFSGSDTPLREFFPKMKKREMKLISTDAVVGAIRNVLPTPT